MLSYCKISLSRPQESQFFTHANCTFSLSPALIRLASDTGVNKYFFLRGGGRFCVDAISVALSAKTGFMQLKNGSEKRTDGRTDRRTDTPSLIPYVVIDFA